MTSKLEHALKENLNCEKLIKLDSNSTRGCINKGYCYSIDEDKTVFLKTNSSRHASIMFDGELESLRHIAATKTIKVPDPIVVLRNYGQDQEVAIVMEYLHISPITDAAAILLGKKLAQLHNYNHKMIRYNRRARTWIGGKAPSAAAIEKARGLTRVSHSGSESEEDGEVQDTSFSRHQIRDSNSSSQRDSEFADKFVPEPKTEEIKEFGFNVPTSCGSIPQVNEWTKDWVSFYARHRIDKAIRSLLSDHGDRDLNQQWSRLQLKIDKFFKDYDDEDKIVPSLLHGDLWSGNVAELDDVSQPAVYDPSSFYGHSEYDFGIARMFGGIPKTFEKSYFEIFPKKKLFEQRNKLYQLFHHLNHWDHFGSGYRASSLNILKELNLLVD